MKLIFTSFLLCISFLSLSQNKYPEVYASEDLVIQEINKHIYRHISYLYFDSYGKVPCNGMIVVDNGEAIVFDTPTKDSVAYELIDWVEENLNCKIKAVVPTHFHMDCLGALNAFHKHNITSYANQTTIDLAKKNDYVLPQNGFEDSIKLMAGNREIIVLFVGEGHTKDNVIAYSPMDQVVFGGCFIKCLGAGKGNLEDANVEEWPVSVEKLKAKFQNVKVVIPGHENIGGTELYDYTIQLFTEK